MGLTYRKGINLGPVRLNLSGSGIGYSVGAGGLRFVKGSNGRQYISAMKGGLRYIETLPKAKAPFPAGMVDLSGGDEFWFDVEGESANQEAIEAAVSEVERYGGDQAIIPVFLYRNAAGGLSVVVSYEASFREVGMIPASTDELRAFTARLGDGEPSVGKCSALVFEDDGKLGLKLNIRKGHLTAGKSSLLPVIVVIALIGLAAAFIKALFGGSRRRR